MNNALLISLFVAFGIVSTNEAIAEVSVADCEAQIVANKNLQILKGKIDLLNTANQPIEILANNKVPSSKKEKEAIALWVEEQRRCSAPGIEYHKSQSPEVGAIFEQAYSELFISAADLYQKKITYGDFARATVRRHQEVRERIAAVIARFREQQQRQQAEKEQREAWERQQEAIATQQEAERQRYLQQERCASLRQQILALSNGPTPYQIQQQKDAALNAAAYQNAQLDPLQRASMGMYQAGGQLGNIVGGMLGGVNPEVAAAQQRQAMLQEQTAIYRRECQQ